LKHEFNHDQWAGGLGFEYFYGFLGSDTDNWHPALFFYPRKRTFARRVPSRFTKPTSPIIERACAAP
jgi:hypothetical protein